MLGEVRDCSLLELNLGEDGVLRRPLLPNKGCPLPRRLSGSRGSKDLLHLAGIRLVGEMHVPPEACDGLRRRLHVRCNWKSLSGRHAERIALIVDLRARLLVDANKVDLRIASENRQILWPAPKEDACSGSTDPEDLAMIAAPTAKIAALAHLVGECTAEPMIGFMQQHVISGGPEDHDVVVALPEVYLEDGVDPGQLRRATAGRSLILNFFISCVNDGRAGVELDRVARVMVLLGPPATLEGAVTANCV